jgi:hypothetical protein
LEARAGVMEELVQVLASGLKPTSTSNCHRHLWGFSNEEIYRELVHERGWSPARYEGWVAGTLKQQLLAEKDV